MTRYVRDEGQEPAFLDRAEKLWLRLAIVMLALFLAGVAAVTYFGFSTLPKLVKESADYKGELCTTPDLLLGSAAFSNPGAVPNPEGGVDVYMIGRMWEWTPNTVSVPVGKPVRFFLTSADVIHGFRIRDTAVNMMVFPGMVASETFTFTKPGDYDIVCTEYCGIDHQNMINTIHVEAAQ